MSEEGISVVEHMNEIKLKKNDHDLSTGDPCLIVFWIMSFKQKRRFFNNFNTCTIASGQASSTDFHTSYFDFKQERNKI